MERGYDPELSNGGKTKTNLTENDIWQNQKGKSSHGLAQLEVSKREREKEKERNRGL